ncbi:TetR/AcrR family transcriptional regulator [Paenibacillus sp. BR2-3]|uniref:TetR/AcrR family transcriptional regulator n=1 Tax=Paenibacillus sp. BR2-3 TaxID=3048494 RepID=UPI003977D76A
MTTESRKEREREEMRTLILESASRIIAEEGIEKLSIRKIANIIEYSPGIIYHYFQGKEDIVEHVLQKGYQQMVSGIRTAQSEGMNDQPALKLKHSLRQFINMSIAEGAQYRNVMLNESPAVLRHTAVLFRGAAQERPAIGMLCQNLRQFQHMKDKEDAYVERTAQVIWSSAFGLIMRLTVEKDLPEEQREALISHYLDAMLAIAERNGN